VNVSSRASADPFPGFFVYAATKAALESLTRSAAKEGAEFGMRAFSVSPGAVETPMLRRLFTPEQLSPDVCLDPEQVAHVVSDCVLGRRDEDSGKVISL
jgi:NAD(P)-dependent dehydrogenase (short-subunit alcohol dehydrogenase family)